MFTKEKSDALTCGSYRDIKLLEHAMEVLERVIYERLRKIVKTDSMQFGYLCQGGARQMLFS